MAEIVNGQNSPAVLYCLNVVLCNFILKEDETPTSIGSELRQFRLGGSPISFQDKASGGSQAWSVEECFAFDHAAARTPEAYLNGGGRVGRNGERRFH